MCLETYFNIPSFFKVYIEKQIGVEFTSKL